MSAATAEKPNALGPEPDPTAEAHQLVHDLIKAEMDNGDFKRGAIADKVRRRMIRDYPEQHHIWCQDQAPRLYFEKVTDLTPRSARRKTLGAAIEAGDDLHPYTWRFAVNDDPSPTMRKLADMTGTDCIYVAGAYQQEKLTAEQHEAWMRWLGKKAGIKKIKEVFSEQQLLASCKRMLG